MTDQSLKILTYIFSWSDHTTVLQFSRASTNQELKIYFKLNVIVKLTPKTLEEYFEEPLYVIP